MKTLNKFWSMIPDWLQVVLMFTFLPLMMLGAAYTFPVLLVLAFAGYLYDNPIVLWYIVRTVITIFVVYYIFLQFLIFLNWLL